MSFLPQIIKYMSLTEMEDAARRETDMVIIHSRTPSVARTWTGGSLGNQIGKAPCPQRKVGERQERGPSSRVGGCGWEMTQKELRLSAWRFTIHRLRLWG